MKLGFMEDEGFGYSLLHWYLHCCYWCCKNTLLRIWKKVM